jgi:hypothetical protein
MTRTETALRALAAALEASAALPTVRRNVTFDQVFEDLAGASPLQTALLLGDGPGAAAERTLGGIEGGRYEIDHPAALDWLVAGSAGTALETAFDAGLEAIAAVIAADRSLGGTVAYVEIPTPPERDLETAGSAQVKIARLVVSLRFTSDLPF